MNRLAKIARSATPQSGIQFRKTKYGDAGNRSFLLDVLAMANAAVDGPRYVVVGADFDSRNRKCLHPLDADDFSGQPSYQSLANEFIEPPVDIRYKPVIIDGKRVGVFEIGDCQDRPYMMRIDFSDTLRRGDAYVRTGNAAMKMGRRQLADLFEKKFQDSVSAGDLEIGFPGEIIHKVLTLGCTNLTGLPSAEAGSKLNQMIDIRKKSRNTGSTTAMARLTHARLFGSDDPYVDRSPTVLMNDLQDISSKYHDHDQHFLFEKHAKLIQLVVYNQGHEPVTDASLQLLMPIHNALFVAGSLPKALHGDSFVDRTPDEIAAYPSVTYRDDSVQVSRKIGDIPVGVPTEIFDSSLRLCVGEELAGKQLIMRYALHAKNLRTPALGKLRITFSQ